ncbi:uncharacterized protein J7T54_007157 [Emericellopsis cladophorae]|uniref:Enoyl reductase (ER) domain-containing protein n=1 Tax=Emericellopsis cladophorae TaxID=2686198 RepID=A0A9P9Y8I0_9HYPO|nr:uncharacterized protein J7T54_007157 [Emericellopsis cladophorae]KAI6785514.1 hypothetical protein J7T54_007157 [Emericellopsis cladophorae]
MPSNNAAYIAEPKKIPLEVKSAPWTEPKDNQILVRNRAVAINPVDIAIQQFAAFEVEYPAIIGTDVAGVVESVGSGVSHFKPGDRVLGYATSLGTKDNAEGAFQNYTIIRSDCASHIPDDLPYEQATVLPLAVATASYAFFGDDTLQLRLPSLNPEKIDEVVLVWGGSSSVGGTAIQLAKAAGYQVITTASAKNHEYVKRLGADHTLDYKSSSVVDDIAKLLQGKKLAGVLDAIGAPDAISTAARAVEHADGKRHIVCVRAPPENLPESVKAQPILSLSIYKNSLASQIFNGFVPKALAQGKLKAEPKAEIVGEGLEKVQAGLDKLRDGVSATKVVVRLK